MNKKTPVPSGWRRYFWLLLLLFPAQSHAVGLHGMWVDDQGNRVDIVHFDDANVKLTTQRGMPFEGTLEGDTLNLRFPFTTFEQTPRNLPEQVRRQLVGKDLVFKGTVEEEGRRITGHFLVPAYNTETFELLEPRQQAIRLTRVPADLKVSISGIDPEQKIAEAVPLQFIRITAETDKLAEPIAQVRNQRTGKGLRIKMRRWDEQDTSSKLWITDPFLIGVEDGEANPPYTQLPACPGDRLQASVAGVSTTLEVTEPDDRFGFFPCKKLILPIFTFRTADDSNRVTINPQADPTERHLKVRLIDEKGQPMANEAIAWRVVGAEELLLNYTDEQGYAQLDFAVGPRGNLYAVVDGLQDGVLVSSGGEQTIQAFPADELTAFFTADAQLDMRVNFIRPTVLEIIESHGREISALVDRDKFFVRVRLGQTDSASYGNRRSFDVQVKGSNGDQLSLTVERTGVPGIFESTVAATAVESDSLLATNEIEAPNGGHIDISFSGQTITVPSYRDSWRLQDAVHDATFDLYEQGITQMMRQPDLQLSLRELLHAKMRLIVNAQAFRNERHPTWHHRLAVSDAYLSLIESSGENLGSSISRPVKDSNTPAYLDSSGIVYFASGEEREVNAAIQEASRTIDRMTMNIPIELMAHMGSVVKGFPDALIAGPYVMITGWTVNGERATGMEQVLGGVETVVTIVTTPILTKGLGSFFRAGRALARRSAITGSRVASSFKLAGKNAPLSSVVRPSLVDDASRAAVRPQGSKRLEEALRRMEKAEKKVDDLTGEIDATKRELEGHERELRRMQEHRDGIRPSAKSSRTWSVHDEIVGRWNRIEQVKRRLAALEKDLAKNRAKFLKASGMRRKILGESLTREEARAILNRGKLPDSDHKINDVMVHENYERQMAQDLADQGFVKSGGVELEYPYFSPLGERYGEGLAAAYERGGTQRAPTRAPQMDHVNLQTLEVADSKYYVFEGPASEKAVAKAVREINETIEKGRLVQIELMTERMGLPRADRRVWDAVLEKPVTIYTPKELPPQVLEGLKELQGPRSSRTLQFKVAEARVLEWFDNMPPAPSRHPRIELPPRRRVSQ